MRRRSPKLARSSRDVALANDDLELFRAFETLLTDEGGLTFDRASSTIAIRDVRPRARRLRALIERIDALETTAEAGDAARHSG